MINEANLPPLRDDIVLFSGPPESSGIPTWTIYDPLRHKYFHIDQLSFEMLARWTIGDAQGLLQSLRQETVLQVNSGDIATLLEFLNKNFLIDRINSETTNFFISIRTSMKQSLYSQTLQNYLFFKIPIFCPQKFLNIISPWTKIFFAPVFPWIVLSIAIIGGYLAGRQGDLFLSTFTAFGTWEGQSILLISIIISKFTHEIGHGIALHRYGGRVPTMGLAFLVMFPVFYTDTGDVWRLQSRRQRLIVGAAGMIAELSLAAGALLLWSFTPDGVVKGSVFILATTVWIGTLVINASPFMRFDGYYLLSDYLKVPNLQDRAFKFARWHLREVIFGFSHPPSEDFNRNKARAILAYAYGAWLYRFVLFIGIALLVYHFFFKVLGLILFSIEIWIFIIRPLIKELRIWWKKRQHIKVNKNTIISAFMLISFIGIVVYPWRTSITAPAVLDASMRTNLYAPAPSMVEKVLVRAGDIISAKQPIYTLGSPFLSFKRAQVIRELRLNEIELKQALVDINKLGHAKILKQKVISLRSQISNIDKKISLLNVTSPSEGRLMNVPSYLRPGLWINESEVLGTIVSTNSSTLTAYVAEEDLSAIHVGTSIKFIPETDPLATFTGLLKEIAPVATEHLEEKLLASIYNGRIDVRHETDGTMRSVYAIYRIKVNFPEIPAPQRIRGTVIIKSTPISFLSRLTNNISMVLMQEGNF